ncbi:MAG: plasmid pRiA4b ORF-3 family protein, partial [Eubacteriales bacterium]|nr:plasmid pRiA4b ORF-3 family protein [Eubacteriales bacterium]
VNYSAGSKDGFYPYEAMMTALSELTGMQAYKYRAFELLVTLDLDIYKAERRIIVPANLEFYRLHKVLQSVYEWRNRHLYDFTVYADNTQIPAARIVPFDEDLDWDENALLMEGRTLAEFMPEYRRIVYTYDMGEYWQHEIRLVRVIEDYDKESPCLLEAVGQGPPEDVGGIGGFIEFRKIMLNPNDPEYRTLFYQSGCWTPELSEWASRPRVIR